MFALDLFNTKYEKELHEGAVDNLEARRIDILNDRMDDLIRRASVPNNKEAREALMHEYNKVKAERDSYYKVNTLKTQDECMGYGTLGEEGIGQDIANKQEKIARATPPTPAGKVASTVKNAAKWLAGRGGPGKEGPTYEGKDDAWQTETPWKEIPKAKSGRPVDPRGEVTHLSDVARREAVLKAHAQKKNSKEVTESQQLHQGDPIVVTAPNEFKGATGEIYEFSPSGTFVIVDLYNHGKHSMHLSDVAYNDYADQEEEDDWYDDEEVEEGFQDFNKVEPYAVCLAGRPVKQFDYYEDARRFHDNWKQKLYREGDKEKADKITLMPIMDEAYTPSPAKPFRNPKGFNKQGTGVGNKLADLNRAELANIQPSKGTPVPAKAFAQGVLKDLKKVNVKEAEGSWIVYDPETKQIKKRFKTHTAGKSYAKAHGLGFASSEYYFDTVKEPAVAEAQTDYQKRRARERDVDAGRPVKALPKNPQTDYARKRAKEKRDLELFGEDQLNELASGYASNKGYDELGVYKRYNTFISKKKFNNLAFIAVAENPRNNEVKFKATGTTPEEAVAKLHAEIDKEIIKAPKVSGAATIDFNVDFVRDILEMRSNPFYAKIVEGPRLIIAGQEMEQYPEIMQDEGFKRSSIRTVGDSENATKLPAMPLSARANVVAGLIANGRYALGQESIDKDGNRIFDLEFDSVVEDPRERIRMGTPAITIATKREVAEESSTASEAVERAILNRIMVAHTDLLKQFGPEKVMQAAEEVAYNVGDVDEIGTSDVSAYVNQVRQILGA